MNESQNVNVVESKVEKVVEKPYSLFKEIFQWIFSVILAIAIAFIIRGYIFEPVLVEGSSMENTLYTGERLILNKFNYHFELPKKNDIVVIKIHDGFIKFMPFINNIKLFKTMYPEANEEVDYIKRVIGLPGDKIDLVDGHVIVNGEKLIEPYAKGTTQKRSMEFPTVVPAGKVFVLGDNREASSDSRQIGFIDIKNVKGKATYRIWPKDVIGGLYGVENQNHTRSVKN